MPAGQFRDLHTVVRAHRNLLDEELAELAQEERQVPRDLRLDIGVSCENPLHRFDNVVVRVVRIRIRMKTAKLLIPVAIPLA